MQQLISSVTASMPSALPTPNSAAIDDTNVSQISPSLLKKPFSKKTKGEDLNKYVFVCVYKILVSRAYVKTRIDFRNELVLMRYIFN